MKSFLISAVAGLAIGALGALAVSRGGAHHQVHYYKTPPEMSATAGLAALTPDQAKAVLSPPKPAPAQKAAVPAAAPAVAPVAAPAAAPKPAAPATTQPAAAPAAPAAAPPAAAGGAELIAAGEKAFIPCKACHTLEAKGADRLGPNLHGVFGRKSGTKEGFKFSEAMTKAAIAWDEATIGKYLENPKTFIPGNRMAFPGVAKPEARAALIAFLKQATK
jgi:cytochrome c